MASCPNQSRPLITYCFNQREIWEQDLRNIQLNNWTTDVGAQRSNQISSIPCPSSQIKNLLSHPLCCVAKPCNLPQDNDNFNLKDVTLESQLIYHPQNHDCINSMERRILEQGSRGSNRQLFHDFHAQEVHHSAYPNQDRLIFDNPTKIKCAKFSSSS